MCGDSPEKKYSNWLYSMLTESPILGDPKKSAPGQGEYPWPDSLESKKVITPRMLPAYEELFPFS